MSLGENIYHFRTAKNLSQGDLADQLEVSRQSVSKWENDIAVPELDKLLKLSKLFGITLDELVGNEAAQDASAQQAPQESENDHKFRGLTLILGGGINLISFVLMGLFWSDAPYIGIILSAPLIVSGIVCVICKNHPVYLSLAVLYFLCFGFQAICMTSTWGTVSMMTGIFIVLWGALLLIYTIVRFRQMTFSKFKKILLIALLSISLAIQIACLLPPATQNPVEIPLETGYVEPEPSQVVPD